jgi:hypothetical protein
MATLIDYLSFTHNAGHIVFEKMMLAAKQLLLRVKSLPRARLIVMLIYIHVTCDDERQ